MHVFYTPDIQKSNELPEEEAQHCTRVLRLGIGDEITLTDGKGNFYKAEITVATNKRCFVTIKETIFRNLYGRAIYTLPWHRRRTWTVTNGLQRKLPKSDLTN